MLAEYWRAVDRCPPGPGETHTTEFSSRNASFDAAEEICGFAEPLLASADSRRL
jgi:polyhydroxybutyrate depolymerase